MASAHILETKRVIRDIRHYLTGANRLLAMDDSKLDFRTYQYTCAYYEMPRDMCVPAPVAELTPNDAQLRELCGLMDLWSLFEQKAWETDRELMRMTKRYKMRMLLRSCVF